MSNTKNQSKKEKGDYQEIKPNISLIMQLFDFLNYFHELHTNDPEEEEENLRKYSEFAKKKFSKAPTTLVNKIVSELKAEEAFDEDKLSKFLENHLDDILFIILNISYLRETFLDDKKEFEIPSSKFSMDLEGVPKKEQQDHFKMMLQSFPELSDFNVKDIGDEDRSYKRQKLKLIEFVLNNFSNRSSFKLIFKKGGGLEDRKIEIEHTDLIVEVLQCLKSLDSKLMEMESNTEEEIRAIKEEYNREVFPHFLNDTHFSEGEAKWNKMNHDTRDKKSGVKASIQKRISNIDKNKKYTKNWIEAQVIGAMIQYMFSTEFIPEKGHSTSNNQLYIIGKVLLWSGLFEFKDDSKRRHYERYDKIYMHVRHKIKDFNISTSPLKYLYNEDHKPPKHLIWYKDKFR